MYAENCCEICHLYIDEKTEEPFSCPDCFDIVHLNCEADHIDLCMQRSEALYTSVEESWTAYCDTEDEPNEDFWDCDDMNPMPTTPFPKSLTGIPLVTMPPKLSVSRIVKMDGFEARKLAIGYIDAVFGSKKQSEEVFANANAAHKIATIHEVYGIGTVNQRSFLLQIANRAREHLSQLK